MKIELAKSLELNRNITAEEADNLFSKKNNNIKISF